MSLPLQTKPLLAEGTGKKLVYRLSYPTGLSAAASTTLTGGTVTGTTTLATGATAAYLGLSEIGTSGYYVLTDGVISALPATDDEPYTVEVRQVDDAVDMTSYAAIAAGFEAATVTIWSEEPMPGAMAGGFVYGETWYADASNAALAAALSAVGEATTPQAIADAMKLAPTAGAADSGSVQGKLDGVTTAAAAAPGVIALPATARLPSGSDQAAGARLGMSRHSVARFPITVRDAFDAVVTDLADRTLRFVVYSDVEVSVLQVEDGVIERVAATAETDPYVIVPVNSGSTAAGQYHWTLWDITAGTGAAIDLGRGVFVIRAASLGT